MCCHNFHVAHILLCRTAGEEQTAASETDSENSNSQAFEIVEKEDVVEPEKGSSVEDIKAEHTEGSSEVEEASKS